SRRCSAIKLHGKKTGDARSVWIGRLRKNDVVAIPRREEDLTRIGDVNVNFRIMKNLMVDCRARAGDTDHRRLELDDVYALHRRNGAQPAGGAARAQSDDQRSPRIRME